MGKETYLKPVLNLPSAAILQSMALHALGLALQEHNCEYLPAKQALHEWMSRLPADKAFN